MNANTFISAKRRTCIVAVLAIGVMAAGATGCRLGRWSLSPFRRSGPPDPTRPKRSWFFSPSRAAKKTVREAAKSYGGIRNWKAIEGLELEMVWKTTEGGRVVEDPALVQMATSSLPQIRIYYSKLDQTSALGDKSAWAMMRSQPDHSPPLVARAHFTSAMMQFFLSLPFNLNDRGVVVRDVETKAWGGPVYDTLRIGFQKGGTYPWPGDTMTLWLRRPTGMIERCFFVSTAQGSAFGPPPNYLWVTWENHTPLNSVPLARRWSFFRAEQDGTMKEKLFDIEVQNAAANRSFLPVLFREPIIEPPPPKSPLRGEKSTLPAVIPLP
jgi:hypothetical protein